MSEHTLRAVFSDKEPDHEPATKRQVSDLLTEGLLHVSRRGIPLSEAGIREDVLARLPADTRESRVAPVPVRPAKAMLEPRVEVASLDAFMFDMEHTGAGVHLLIRAKCEELDEAGGITGLHVREYSVGLAASDAEHVSLDSSVLIKKQYLHADERGYPRPIQYDEAQWLLQRFGEL